MLELWHAAGRAAGDGQKRRVALLGVLASTPTLIVGASLSRLLSGPTGAFAGLGRPLAYVFGPLTDAYRGGHDVALLGYLALQGLLLTLVWSRFGGALHRMAAVELTQGRRESARAALRFARRHGRGFVGSKAALFLGTFLPLALAAGLATVGRLDGALGSVLLALMTIFVVVLVFLGVFLGSCWLVAGFLTTPTIAVEDGSAFDALSRTFGYAGAGLPRLTLWRLAFLGGVLVGTTWRALRTVVVVGVALAILRLGAGAAALDRAQAVLTAGGRPADAARLGITWGDQVLALVLAVVLFGLVATWLADLVSRCACGRTALYLGLRARIDRVERSVLRSPPEVPPFEDAATAGFEEVTRLDPPEA